VETRLNPIIIETNISFFGERNFGGFLLNQQKFLPAKITT